MLTLPKDTPRMRWTRHIKNKMVFYHLSQATILGVLRRPERREEGVAPETIASMKTKKKLPGSKAAQKPEEIWIMYKTAPQSKKITMISAWRYPGKTKPGAGIPIPEDTLEELAKLL